MAHLILISSLCVVFGIVAGYFLSLIGPLGFLLIPLLYFLVRFMINRWVKTKKVGSGVAGGLAAMGLGVMYYIYNVALISFSIALTISFTLSLAFLR